ncbi:unnamed protein product [Trifolium pratense]|uniref:Uncharacterized protein n=1 Tax=Trifolium pratense TaxID=57577 RepID=A0ACB0K8S9_TRIPR|nr:unnamed protein product [Trifolium pratense]
MTSSSSSLENNNNNNFLNNFTFSTHPFMITSSFSDLLASTIEEKSSGERNGYGYGGGGNGGGVPKFKSIPPPSLPLSPPPVSPSSYFSIPPGLSPAELLDSPIMLNSSNILPSPTTGSFTGQSHNWMNNSEENQIIPKESDKSFSNFSFQTQQGPAVTGSNTTLKSSTVAVEQQPWSYQEITNQNGFSPENNMIQTENNSSMQSFSPETNMIQAENNNISMQSFSPEIANFQTITNNNGFQLDHNTNYTILSRRSDDGYNWRKYGQKQVRGSENPRSYYKCTYPNCPTKKKVERSIEGQITEIVYKGNHNHPKPQAGFRRNSSSSSNSLVIVPVNPNGNEIHDHSYGSHGNGQMDSVATPENSSISIGGDDDFEQSSLQRARSVGADEFVEEEPEPKRWRNESENQGIVLGHRTVREPRVVVQTTSDIDILDDGYKWRKYGQKVVKGNPNPRSYYKCTYQGCPVRKHVERASHDIKAVITTYEGKHTHDVPAARGSGSNSMNRPTPSNPLHQSNVPYSIRPLQMQLPQGQVRPFHPDLLLGQGNYGISGFGNQMMPYMNHQQQQQQQHMTENGFSSRANDEPKDFLASLLC